MSYFMCMSFSKYTWVFDMASYIPKTTKFRFCSLLEKLAVKHVRCTSILQIVGEAASY